MSPEGFLPQPSGPAPKPTPKRRMVPHGVELLSVKKYDRGPREFFPREVEEIDQMIKRWATPASVEVKDG